MSSIKNVMLETCLIMETNENMNAKKLQEQIHCCRPESYSSIADKKLKNNLMDDMTTLLEEVRL